MQQPLELLGQSGNHCNRPPAHAPPYHTRSTTSQSHAVAEYLTTASNINP